MQPSYVKKVLGEGGVSLGTFVFEFNTSGIARLAREAGAEFVIFDMEHSGWSVETIRNLIATTPRPDIVPVVRIPATEYHFVARVLDMGAMGIMVPMVESVEQAETLVRSAKYPPQGRRGAAFAISHDDYRSEELTTSMASSNGEQLLIAQIETVAGLEACEAIAAVDGIDVLWIGQFDLTCSMGIPGQFDHPRFHEALDRVVAACRDHDTVAGYMACSAGEATQMIQRGFRILAVGGDLWVYQQALAADLRQVRQHL